LIDRLGEEVLLVRSSQANGSYMACGVRATSLLPGGGRPLCSASTCPGHSNASPDQIPAISRAGIAELFAPAELRRVMLPR
jgi:hypothetical protein